MVSGGWELLLAAKTVIKLSRKENLYPNKSVVILNRSNNRIEKGTI
jgi:hypothetical protein